MRITYEQLEVGDWIRFDFIWDHEFYVTDIDREAKTFTCSSLSWMRGTRLEFSSDLCKATLIGVAVLAKHGWLKKLPFVKELLHDYKKQEFDPATLRLLRL